MSLAPTLLLSMPQLIDPNFARSVVLLCEHAPEGAFGLVVNRPSDVSAAEAVRLEPALADANDLPLLIGGPVEPQRGWILTAQPPEAVEYRERRRRALSVGVAGPAPEGADGAADAAAHACACRLRRLGARPARRRAAQSAWLTLPVELDLIFEIPAAAAWEMAIRRLGADPHLLQMGHGVH